MKTCECCNTQFTCGAAENSPCWCLELPKAKVPQNYKDCLCSKCLKLFINPESEDFYLDENGNTVFTASYHLKRGSCCKNNCLHCPY